MVKFQPKMAYMILETQTDSKGNLIPCIVKEGESGFFLTDWQWGKDIEVARKLADEHNERMGVSKEEAFELTLQSMRPRKEVKKTVLGCNSKKDCKADEGLTQAPFTCCEWCKTRSESGCPNESEQCPEVPDTCCGVMSTK